MVSWAVGRVGEGPRGWAGTVGALLVLLGPDR